jgi:hypothetical protein
VTAIVLPSDQQAAILRRLGDTLAPANGGLPSFSEADRSGRFLRRAFERLPHLGPLALAAADGLGDAEPLDYVQRLAEEQPQTFSALHLILVGAYLINRRVWRRLDYPGRKPLPLLEDEADFYLEGDLLKQVIARGPIYRPAPPNGRESGTQDGGTGR